MALFDDVFKGGNIVTAIAVTVGAAVLAPVVGPLVRPFAKAVLKAGILAYDQGKVMMADLNERTEDIIAEVREEIEQETAQGNSEASHTPAA